MNIVDELEKLREFLHGAHMATNDVGCAEAFHRGCHKIDDILTEIKVRNAQAGTLHVVGAND